MAILVNDILKRASTLLNDLGGTRWPPAEMIDWLNEGQQALAKIKADAKVVTAPVTLVAGALQSLPDDGIALIGVLENVGGSAVTPCDKSALDMFSPGWVTRPTAAKVIHFMPGEKRGTFYVYPAQSSTPAQVRVSYAAKPETVSSNEEIDVRDIYADNIVNYILYRALSKDAEVGHADRAAAYYQAFIA